MNRNSIKTTRPESTKQTFSNILTSRTPLNRLSRPLATAQFGFAGFASCRQ